MKSPQSDFNSLMQVDEFGEWWSARDLMPHYGYATWNKFKPCVERAKLACASSARDVTSNFLRAERKNASRHRIDDYRLTRYAAYLTAMEGDPSKPQIGAAKTYFAIQTHKAEIGIDGFDDTIRPIYDMLRALQQVRNQQNAHAVQLEVHDQQIAEHAQAIEGIRVESEAAYRDIEARHGDLVQLTERVSDVERVVPLTDTSKTYSGKEVAQLLGMGHINFFRRLRDDLGVIYQDQDHGGHKIYQRYMDLDWGKATLMPKLNGAPGLVWVPRFTARGIAGIQKKLSGPA
jgi:phage antirepressor YoqD-like protein